MLTMFNSLPSSLLFSALILAVTALPVESVSSQVGELTASTFPTTIKQGVWFIDFFSPICQHCRLFEPTWKQLVKHVESQKNPGISLAQVNCVTQADLCNDQKIRAYPSLKLYDDGKEVDEFEDERDFDLLVKYIEEHARGRPTPTPTPTPTPSPTPEPSPNPSGVVLSLNKSSFKDATTHGPTFVKFFAPWCGYCKKLAPTWMVFASRMKNKVEVAEVNCEEHSSLCKEQKIQGYPTILFYQHGRTIDYTSQRRLEDLEKFVETVLAPPLQSISVSKLPSVVESDEVLYLLIHDELKQDLRDRVEEAVQPLEGFPRVFSLQYSPELSSSISINSKELPVLVALKDHSMTPFKKLALHSDARIPDMSEWLIQHSLPISTELSGDNFGKIMGKSSAPSGSSRLVVLGALDVQSRAQVNVIKEAGTTWSRANSDSNVVFVWMDKEEWGGWLKSMYGIKKDAKPTVVIVDHKRLLYYDISSKGEPIQLEASSITSTLDDVIKGMIKPKHSENIAERLARRLYGWLGGVQSTISHHPILTMILLVITCVGVFHGAKRILDNDSRKTAIYTNHKSGARLD